MQEKSAQEFIRGERERADLVPVLIVLPPKRHRVVGERHQPMIGDGDAVRVSRERCAPRPDTSGNLAYTSRGGIRQPVGDRFLISRTSAPLLWYLETTWKVFNRRITNLNLVGVTMACVFSSRRDPRIARATRDTCLCRSTTPDALIM